MRLTHKHGPSVEHITLRVWGGMELLNAGGMVKSDASLLSPYPGICTEDHVGVKAPGSDLRACEGDRRQ